MSRSVLNNYCMSGHAHTNIDNKTLILHTAKCKKH